MKFKLVVGLLFSALVSANSYAMEINGGKLISHKEWTKGNVIKSSFQDVKEAQALSFNHTQSEDGPWIFAKSKAHPFLEKNVVVNTNATFMGENLVYIFNSDSVQRTYTITTVLLVQSPCQNPDDVCPIASTTAKNIVTLDPHGMMKVTLAPTLTTQFSVAGTAKSWVQSEVTTNDTTIHFADISNLRSVQVTSAVK